jgi:hypothetical protein
MGGDIPSAHTPGTTIAVHYVRQPFRAEPDFGATSLNYSMAELLARASKPT